MISLFLGAGFSKWSADLPLAKDLFDFSFTPFGKSECSKLQICANLKREWDCLYPSSHVEEFIASTLASSSNNQDILLWYIVRRLSDPFISYDIGSRHRHVLMIDEYRKFECPGIKATLFFLSKLMPALVGIITTNYDMIIEYALGTKCFNYGQIGETLLGRGPYPVSQWLKPVSLTGSIPLAKLHGSISWGKDGKRYSEGRKGITGDALIIAPVHEKDVPSQLINVWNTAKHTLVKSDTIITFGFAFNPYDKAVLDLLSENGKNINKVVIVDVQDLSKRSKDIWPNADHFWISPPVKEKTDTYDWFTELFRVLGYPMYTCP